MNDAIEFCQRQIWGHIGTSCLKYLSTYLWKYPSYAPVSQSSYTLRYTLALSDSQYINIFTIRTLMIHYKLIHKTELIK